MTRREELLVELCEEGRSLALIRKEGWRSVSDGKATGLGAFMRRIRGGGRFKDG